MRSTFASMLLLAHHLLCAQTISTVQDGPWTTPSTWSCNCVPGSTNPLVIDHNVTLTADLNLNQPAVTIGSSGRLSSATYVELTTATNLTLAGTIDLVGVLTSFDTVTVSGSIALSLYYDIAGLIEMAGGHMEIAGNFMVFSTGTVTGDGSICVGGTSNVAGILTGSVDVCDITPLATQAPFIDNVSGTVGPDVTWCAAGPCAVGIKELAAPELWVVGLVHDRLTFASSVPGGDWTLYDITGKEVLTGHADKAPSGTPRTVDIGKLSSGLHFLRMHAPCIQQDLVLKFVSE